MHEPDGSARNTTLQDVLFLHARGQGFNGSDEEQIERGRDVGRTSVSHPYVHVIALKRMRQRSADIIEGGISQA